ncbi:hypothetical protein P153DRAFT_363623 [Dothidotthia symphoricarpi CBS 119687]|uniref:HAD-like protein n=1 Tax=Dothidotthia symphoricarpi CBS 119687 TaxID=1392245 RepID=A0A6A6AR10_9PLEO|nr:uncharacterized protein P153DRAFT_363623 [Dothidotthia symphoricarpi CBS 119687]KAF2133435.1 hypothetical protein P153DRAFT_363623 [Dothidotthia symphoricarpi CBS 119687]
MSKRNLLLCFDAFGTLFTPSTPIPTAYVQAAARHGINCGNAEHPKALAAQFKLAFKDESKQNPNYGRATGLGAEKWWGNVIQKSFKEFVKPDQEVPQALITDLLRRYSTKEGYRLYPDVLPFFQTLRDKISRGADASSWPWDKTVVGIITNSDDRVPGILNSFGLRIGPRRVGKSDQRSQKATLGDDISFVVLSYDVGFEKPDRRMFDAASEMLQETLAGNDEELKADDFEKLYVGDELEKDYLGAEAAGWNSIYLDRGSSTGGSGGDGELELVRKNVTDKEGKTTCVTAAKDLRALGSWCSSRKIGGSKDESTD